MTPKQSQSMRYELYDGSQLIASFGEGAEWVYAPGLRVKLVEGGLFSSFISERRKEEHGEGRDS